MKQCVTCCIFKNLDSFGLVKGIVRNTCKQCINIQAKIRYDNQTSDEKEKYLAKKRIYDHSKYQKVKNQKQKKTLDPIQHRLRKNLRRRLSAALKGNYKTGSAIKDLGCSIEFFKSYLESKFQQNMNWDNYGFYGWHIDHIKPLWSFDLTNPIELRQAVHYTNLQPLWAIDNYKKKNKLSSISK
jgi:hypothetical protein